MSWHRPWSGRGDEKPKKTKWELIQSSRRLLNYLRPYWVTALLLFVATMAATALALVMPRLIGWLVDKAILPKDPHQLGLLCLAALGVYLLGALLRFTHSFFAHRMGQRIILTLRQELFEHLQALSVRFFEDRPTGDIMSRVVNDSRDVEHLIVHAAESFINSVLTLVGVTILLFVMNAQLAAYTLIPIPLIVGTIIFFARRFKRVFRAFREKLGELNTFLQERISGIRIIKSSTSEVDEQRRFEVQTQEYYDAFMRAAMAFSTFGPLMMFLSQIGVVLVMFLGGRLAIGEQLSLGDFTAFLLYMRMFYAPIHDLGRLLGHSLPSALAAADRIFEFLDAEDKLEVPPDAIRPDRLRGEIEFRHVGFRYIDEQHVLRDINLTVAPRETIALVGPSGGGKTTLADLVSRFYDPQHGHILIDGLDVKRYQPRALRQQIGVVLQEPFLFNVSIKENIAYGKPEASDDEIQAAARKAGAHEFICALVDGYDTVVGERGVKVSVGEKQRISIARALLKDPAILVLDEATSSVDTETEREIQRALEEAARGRTTIIIAHRLSTTKMADRILVLEGGRITEQGTPDELMARGGIYARFWKMQNLGWMDGPDLE